SMVFALEAVRLISRCLFRDLPGGQVTLDLRDFGIALLCSILTGLIFGTIPAWLASRPDVNRALKEQTRGATTNSHYRTRHALIVGEVAFAVILLSGAGLLLRGIQRFVERDPGWRVDGLLTAQLNLQGPTYAAPAQRLSFYERIGERFRSLPGVERVAISASQ